GVKPSQRTAMRIYRALHTMTGRRTVEVVGHIILAGPHELHGTADLLRNLRRLRGEIGHITAPESSAHVGGMHSNFLGLEAENLRDCSLHPIGRLSGSPDFGLASARMHGDIHRFHGGVRQQWKLVNYVDLLGAVRQNLVYVAVVPNSFSGLVRSLA